MLSHNQLQLLHVRSFFFFYVNSWHTLTQMLNLAEVVAKRSLPLTCTLHIEHLPFALALTCVVPPCRLLIGINYIRTPRAKLSGCINDAISMLSLLVDWFRSCGSHAPADLRYYLLTHGFDAASIVVLTDDATDASLYPSRANIIAQMRNLVAGVQPGDSLWFSFSGHGSQVADTSGDEADGMDETICPADYTTAGQIVDDDIYDMLVKPLPPGARMHAIMVGGD